MNGIADFFNLEKDPNQFNLRDVTDFFVDPSDPLSMALAPLYFAGPLGAAANRGIMAARGGYKVGKNVLNPAVSSNMTTNYMRSLPENIIQGGVDNQLKLLGTALTADILLDPEVQEIFMEIPPDERPLARAEAEQIIEKDMLKDIPSDASLTDLMMPTDMAEGGIAKFSIGSSIKGVVKGAINKVKGFFKKKADDAKPKTDKPKTKSTDEFEDLDVKVVGNRVITQDGKSLKIDSPQGKVVLEAAKLRRRRALEAERLKRQEELKGPVERGLENVVSGTAGAARNVGSNVGRFVGPRISANPMTAGLLGALGIGVPAGLAISNLLSGDDEDKDDDDDPTPTPAPTPAPEVTQPQLNAFQRYQKLLSENPDFARAQLAGFMNMMKPQAGIVPISAPVAFVEGMLGEEDRQRKGTPAEIKTLQFLQANPDLAQFSKSLGGSKAGSTAAFELANNPQFAIFIKNRLGTITGDPGKFDILANEKQDPTLLYKLAILQQTEGDAALLAELTRLDDKGQPIYSVKKKDD